MTYTHEYSPANKQAVAAFFVALLSVFFFWIPALSFLFIIIAAILGVAAYKAGNRGAAPAALFISGIVVVICLIVSLSCSSLLGFASGSGSSAEDEPIPFSEDYSYESNGDLSGADLSNADLSASDAE